MSLVSMHCAQSEVSINTTEQNIQSQGVPIISGAILITATVGIIAAVDRAGFTGLLTCGVKLEKHGHFVEGTKNMISKGEHVLNHFHVDCTQKSPKDLNIFGAMLIWFIIGTTVVHHGTYAINMVPPMIGAISLILHRATFGKIVYL
ncbi:hypothetical protein CHS0354_003820 [Potamilus streckersoni]|uniref:Uncharacterized protein n=1 Tax=Potamilus streckersoni TaxID=2493646 RepID=A0AAE0VV68_9BIVA|nr:hypothetical protein CHS0354_003820 [Potamilus streckersoni]